MYHVVSTGIATVILYFITYFFSKTGFFSKNDHRKFWNIILAVTFILTLSAGLVLALQITYKWNIPIIKSVLKWHVECGIGFSFTGIFHFMWHLPYFNTFYIKTNDDESGAESLPFVKKEYLINLGIIGFVSTAVQLLLIREIMNLAGGYELIAGTFLSSWLAGSAFGSAMAKRSSLNDIKKINLLFAVYIPVTVLLLIVLEKLFLNQGETPSYLISVIITLISLFPFCFVSGFTFVKLLKYGEAIAGYRVGKSFSAETAGSVLAGLAVSILLAGLLNTYQLLLLIIVMNISYVLISFYIKNHRGKLSAYILSTVLVAAILLSNPDIFFRQQFLKNIKIKDTMDTPYGNITIGEYKGEKSIYYNQRLQSYANNEIEREENVHYAMLQHNDPRNILIISGDIMSTLPEILKYKPEKVFFVERDPALIRSEFPDNDSLSRKVNIINDDPFRFIRHTREKFDVILLLLPPPSTLLINRFYTTEFFIQAKKSMYPNGIFACSPGSGENYYSKESVVLFSSVYNSLKDVYKNVMPVAGNKLYFISSDGEVTTSVCMSAGKKGIMNTYVNSDYLSDDLIKKKSDDVISVVNKSIRQNTSGFPVACFHYQSFNLSKNNNEKIPAIIVLVLIFLLPVLSVKRKNLIMFSSAASLAGFEIIVLIALQTAVGNMYLLTGLVIASCMTGLAIGSYYNIKYPDNTTVRITGLILTIVYICIGLIINNIQLSTSHIVSLTTLLVLIFIPSFLTGSLFNTMTRSMQPFSDPSAIYSADLKGSALGFIVVSGFILPAAGMSMTIFFLALVIFSALLFGTIGNK